MTEVKLKKEISSQELSQLVVKGMQERKATNIVVMDLRKVKNAFTDFLSFVLVILIHKLMLSLNL